MLASGRPAELKALPEVTPPGTRRVQVRYGASGSHAMHSAHALRYVVDVAIFGETLHLLVEEGVEDDRLLADLRGSLAAHARVSPAETSLEDVFVCLANRASAGSAAQGRSGSS